MRGVNVGWFWYFDGAGWAVGWLSAPSFSGSPAPAFPRHFAHRHYITWYDHVMHFKLRRGLSAREMLTGSLGAGEGRHHIYC